MLPFSGLEHFTSMLGDIVLFTYDELIVSDHDDPRRVQEQHYV